MAFGCDKNKKPDSINDGAVTDSQTPNPKPKTGASGSGVTQNNADPSPAGDSPGSATSSSSNSGGDSGSGATSSPPPPSPPAPPPPPPPPPPARNIANEDNAGGGPNGAFLPPGPVQQANINPNGAQGAEMRAPDPDPAPVLAVGQQRNQAGLQPVLQPPAPAPANALGAPQGGGMRVPVPAAGQQENRAGVQPVLQPPANALGAPQGGGMGVPVLAVGQQENRAGVQPVLQPPAPANALGAPQGGGMRVPVPAPGQQGNRAGVPAANLQQAGVDRAPQGIKADAPQGGGGRASAQQVISRVPRLAQAATTNLVKAEKSPLHKKRIMIGQREKEAKERTYKQLGILIRSDRDENNQEKIKALLNKHNFLRLKRKDSPILMNAVMKEETNNIELFLKRGAVVEESHLNQAVAAPCSLEVLNSLLKNAKRGMQGSWLQKPASVKAITRCVSSKKNTQTARGISGIMMGYYRGIAFPSSLHDANELVNLAKWLVKNADFKDHLNLSNGGYFDPQQGILKKILDVLSGDEKLSVITCIIKYAKVNNIMDDLFIGKRRKKKFWKDTLAKAVQQQHPDVTEEALKHVDDAQVLGQALEKSYTEQDDEKGAKEPDEKYDVGAEQKIREVLLNGLMGKDPSVVISTARKVYASSFSEELKGALKKRLQEKIGNISPGSGDTFLHKVVKQHDEFVFDLFFSKMDGNKKQVMHGILPERRRCALR